MVIAVMAVQAIAEMKGERFRCAGSGHGCRLQGDKVVELRGIEPLAYALRTRRSPS